MSHLQTALMRPKHFDLMAHSLTLSLQHVVVFLLGAERLLEDGDVPLVVVLLLLLGLQLGRQSHDVLVPPLNLSSGLVIL